MTHDDYLRQAGLTAHDYMIYAVRDIEAIFGKGYAEKHPELVGAYIRTCAADFHTAILTQESLPAISEALGRLGEILNELEVTQAIQFVGRALDRLGTADAATPMGAIEMLAMEVKNGFEGAERGFERVAEHIGQLVNGFDETVHVTLRGTATESDDDGT